MQKKAFALILLACLVAMPFILKIPGIKATSTQEAFSWMDLSTTHGFDLSTQRINFTFYCDLSNATFPTYSQTSISIWDSGEMYGWNIFLYSYVGGGSEMSIVDSMNWGEVFVDVFSIPQNFTFAFDGTNLYFNNEIVGNSTTSDSIPQINSENMIQQIHCFNPSYHGQSGTITFIIDNFFTSPSPTPSSSPTPSPTHTPTTPHGGGGSFETSSPTSTPSFSFQPTLSQTQTGSNPYFSLPFLALVMVVIVGLNYKRTH